MAATTQVRLLVWTFGIVHRVFSFVLSRYTPRLVQTEFGFHCCVRLLYSHRPHRLVVRTSRCGRDNPGSTPGVDIYVP